MKKNINQYWDKYKKLYSFEEFSAIYREVELLKSVSFKGKNVIEIGCGFRPLFSVAKDYLNYIAIEPGKNPFNDISDKSKNFNNVKVFNSTFEDWSLLNKYVKADLIVLPGVLHEVNNALQVLEKCLNHLDVDGEIYINVPNVNSLHRKIAVSIGIINDVYEKSSRNIELEQSYNFSTKSLSELLKSLTKKVNITKLKTFFLKPFTHDQMLSIFSSGIIDEKIIKGLYEVSDQTKDLGSEIACVVKYKGLKE